MADLLVQPDPYLTPVAGLVAQFCRVYPSDPADMRQEILVEFCEPRFQRRLAAVDEADDGARTRYVMGMARRVAYAMGVADKAAAEGFDPSDIYRYGPAQVEALLETLFAWRRHRHLPAAVESEHVSNGVSPVSERGGMIAALADIGRVYDQMPDRARLVLETAYGDMADTALLADELGTTDDNARQLRRRNVDRLVRRLNDFRHAADAAYGGPGARTVISNTRAQQLTD